MNLRMKSEGNPSLSRKGRVQLIGALFGAGVLGLGGIGWLLARTAQPPKQPTVPKSPDEAKLSVQAEAEKAKAQREGERLKQAEFGAGLQFDSQGNLVLPPPQGADSGGLQNMALDQLPSTPDLAPITSQLRPSETAPQDPGVLREQREARREERQELNVPMLGYSTSPGASWAVHRPEGARTTTAAPSQDPATARLTQLTEKALEQQLKQGQNAPAAPLPPRPAQLAAQAAEPGELADMRVATTAGPDQVVREGKFLDCALVNRIESDIADSPVILQVTRDFLSPDGRYVLVPAGSRIHGVASSVHSLQQARLYMAFHRILYPVRQGERECLSAFFPTRKFPAMDNLGSLGVQDKVNRHFLMQFGAAIMLGLLDGAAASVQSAGAVENPAMRDLMLARTSQNFAQVVGAVIQRYANVVPTVTIREGRKVKVYFTQDVILSPWAETGQRAWVQLRQP